MLDISQMIEEQLEDEAIVSLNFAIEGKYTRKVSPMLYHHTSSHFGLTPHRILLNVMRNFVRYEKT